MRPVIALVAAVASVALLVGGEPASAATESYLAASGRNTDGELGDGTGANSLTRVQVLGLGTSIDIADMDSGYAHNVVVFADGRVRAWGTNYDGEVGDGSTETRLSKVAVVGLGVGSGVVDVAAGYSHSLALKSDGAVLAWGRNESGELGDGSGFPNRYTPVPVSGLGAGSGVIAVAAGGNHSLALKSDGAVLAWGYNEYGTLGDGTTVDRPTPVPVAGLGPGSGVVAVEAGVLHSLALKADGTVLAWGSNTDGRIGVGTFSGTYPTPTPVNGLGPGSGVVSISAGEHTLALKADGSVLAWGYGSFGQIGDGFEVSRYSPTPVAGLGPGSGVTSVAAGNQHSLAVTSDGRVWGWGWNRFGQLSTGTNQSRQGTPVLAGTLRARRAVAGRAYTLVQALATSVNAHPAATISRRLNLTKAVNLVRSRIAPCSRNLGPACTEPSTVNLTVSPFNGDARASARAFLCNAQVLTEPVGGGAGDGQGDVDHACDFGNVMGGAPMGVGASSLTLDSAGNCCIEGATVALQLPSSTTLTQRGGPLDTNANAAAVCPPTPSQIAQGWTCVAAFGEYDPARPADAAAQTGYRQVFVKSPVPTITCGGGTCPGAIATGTTIELSGVQFPCKLTMPDDPSTPNVYDGSCLTAHSNKTVLLKRVSTDAVESSIAATSQSAGLDGSYTLTFTMPSVAAPGENYKLVPHAQACSFPCESGTANAAGKFFTHA